MIKLVVATVGLLIGIFLGAALLMLNPVILTQPGPVGLEGAVRSLEWGSGDGFRGFELTPSGLLGLDAGRDSRAFAEPGIRFARVEVVGLSGEGGSLAALGVRLSWIARPNSLLQARLGVATAWNIVWPEKGTMFLAGSENFWSPLRDGLWSAVRGRGFQPRPKGYVLPPVPGMGSSKLMGGSGEFAGAHGAFRERFTPIRERPGDLVGRREIQFAVE